ncbi:hemolysin family protein [Rummeliibacillus sp. G93]|uniref:hemolysin family protein n=1 Tax=Rummeliibacillus sp. G93 TaxID=2939494 RepID=UPI00201BBD8F|nr:hemolysin family protein [Rummeliibacillus sp. G93]UQW96773.1 hemolysin family protein [Rummeliibacillus sp. G93]
MDIAIRLTAFAVLIACSAVFVATEFAIVKVRTTRIDQLIAEGNKKAIKAKKVISNLDEYLSACQLGITITSLGLGWLGEGTVAKLLEPLFNLLQLNNSVTTFLSFIISFSIVTFVHVVVGELAPKTLAIQKAENVALGVSGFLIGFHNVMFIFIKILNSSANGLARLFGLKPTNESEVAMTEEELRIILSDSLKGGEINQSEYKYVNSIFEFDDRTAKEIMVPRTEIIGIEKELTLKEVFEVMGVEQYTRYPIIEGDKDHIIGLVNMKHLLTAYIKNPAKGATSVTQYMQPIIRVFETMPISDLLLKFQRERIHMAILMDEYGGTSGLVTIEDIIEEIVGDIRDEFDQDEVPEIRKVDKDHFIFDAKMLIENVNDFLGIRIEEDDIDTIGGWFMTKDFEAIKGEKITEQGYEFIIKELDGHHILYLEVIKLPKSSETAATVAEPIQPN